MPAHPSPSHVPQEPGTPSPGDVHQCLHTLMQVHKRHSGHVPRSQDGSNYHPTCCPGSWKESSCPPPILPQDMLIPEGREIISFLQKKVQIRFSHPSPRRRGADDQTEVETQRETMPDTVRGTARHTAKTLLKDTSQNSQTEPQRNSST